MKRKQGKQSTDSYFADEEIVIALPANGVEAALGSLLASESHTGTGAPGGALHQMAVPTGRDKPFPCFMKQSRGDNVIVRIIQSPSPP
jgi:hypothetical protein